jgi:hypothetical protein
MTQDIVFKRENDLFDESLHQNFKKQNVISNFVNDFNEQYDENDDNLLENDFLISSLNGDHQNHPSQVGRNYLHSRNPTKIGKDIPYDYDNYGANQEMNQPVENNNLQSMPRMFKKTANPQNDLDSNKRDPTDGYSNYPQTIYPRRTSTNTAQDIIDPYSARPKSTTYNRLSRPPKRSSTNQDQNEHPLTNNPNPNKTNKDSINLFDNISRPSSKSKELNERQSRYSNRRANDRFSKYSRSKNTSKRDSLKKNINGDDFTRDVEGQIDHDDNFVEFIPHKKVNQLHSSPRENLKNTFQSKPIKRASNVSNYSKPRESQTRTDQNKERDTIENILERGPIENRNFIQTFLVSIEMYF